MFEASPELREVGAGIGVPPNAVHAHGSFGLQAIAQTLVTAGPA